MAVLSSSVDLFALATLPAAADEAEGPPLTNFYELRDNLPLVIATFMRIGYWRDRRKGNEVSDADIRELKELHEMSFMALLMGGLILPPLAWIVYGIPPIHAPAPTSRRLHSLAASIWRNRTGDAARGDSPPGS